MDVGIALPTNFTFYEDGTKPGLISVFLESDYDDYDPCSLPSSADHRWYFVAIAGTLLSIVSIICNAMITVVLLKKKYAHFYFLGLLAASDMFLSICYGPVIAMDVIKNRLQVLWLTRLYWSYVGPLLSLCHVSMTFSCLMIILGTIERYLITEKSRFLNSWRQNRQILAIMMMGVSMILRGTEIFEYTLKKNGNCTDLTEYEPVLTELVHDYFYGTLFRFYARNILTVFVPFALLAYLNARIVHTLRKQQRSASMFRFGSSEHKLKIRSATRLLVLIVFSYLIANVLNVIITAWEYVDFESTQNATAFEIYEILTDIISVLYVFVCASRLPFYMVCNQELRWAFYESLCMKSKFDLISQTSKKYQQPQKLTVSIQKSNNFGTEFDRIAIAIAGTPLKTSPRDFPSPPYEYSNDTTQNNQMTDQAMIIENPLADFENIKSNH